MHEDHPEFQRESENTLQVLKMWLVHECEEDTKACHMQVPKDRPPELTPDAELETLAYMFTLDREAAPAAALDRGDAQAAAANEDAEGPAERSSDDRSSSKTGSSKSKSSSSSYSSSGDSSS